MAVDTASRPAPRHRPKATTVFAAAFVAGAVAAVAVNRVLDVHLAQAKPQVESEPIFVTLRPLAQGAPVTVWDVALRDWPLAMLPSTALRATDSFSGAVLKYPLREGQPLLSVHLVAAEPAAALEPRPPIEEAYVPPPQARPVAGPSRTEPEPDPWMPEATAAAQPAEPKPAVETVSPVATVTRAAPADAPEMSAPDAESVAAAPAAVAPDEQAATEQAATEQAATEQAVAAPTGNEPTLAADDGRAEAESPASQAVAAEPAPAAGVPTEAAEPAPAAPAVPRQARLPTDMEAAPDVPSRPAFDLDSLPSVMARTDESSEPAREVRAAGPVRYLVVPERIARQADTLFAVPEAPPVEQAAPPAATPAPSSRQSGQAAPTTRRQPQRSTTEQRPQRTDPEAAGPRVPQPSARRPTTRQPAQPPVQGRSGFGPRAWGEMFPNLSAGAEAIGNRWRGSEPLASEPAAPDQPRK